MNTQQQIVAVLLHRLKHLSQNVHRSEQRVHQDHARCGVCHPDERALGAVSHPQPAAIR